jgi:hypothetical protein
MKKESAEKIMTKHPLGKTGRNIDRELYERVREALITILKNRELTHTELFEHLEKRLKNKVDGNIGWYGETVKLDLEARKVIERTGSKPQKYRLVSP